MVDDGVLAYETAMMYQHVAGFQPEKNSLLHWIAFDYDNSRESITIHIRLQDSFPDTPPLVSIMYSNGERYPLRTRRGAHWRRDYHLYQIAQEAQKEARRFSRQKTSSAVPSTDYSQQMNRNLENQKKSLLQMIAEKKNELKTIKESSTPVDVRNVAQSSLMQMELELSEIEDSFNDGVIDVKKFCNDWFELRQRHLKLFYSLNN